MNRHTIHTRRTLHQTSTLCGCRVYRGDSKLKQEFQVVQDLLHASARISMQSHSQQLVLDVRVANVQQDQVILDARKGGWFQVKLCPRVQVMPQMRHQHRCKDPPNSVACNFVGMPPCQMTAVVLSKLTAPITHAVTELSRVHTYTLELSQPGSMANMDPLPGLGSVGHNIFSLFEFYNNTELELTTSICRTWPDARTRVKTSYPYV